MKSALCCWFFFLGGGGSDFSALEFYIRDMIVFQNTENSYTRHGRDLIRKLTRVSQWARLQHESLQWFSLISPQRGPVSPEKVAGHFVINRNLRPLSDGC